jgi:hypothetical protein
MNVKVAPRSGRWFGKIGAPPDQNFGIRARHKMLAGNAGRGELDAVTRFDCGDIAIIPIEPMLLQGLDSFA